MVTYTFTVDPATQTATVSGGEFTAPFKTSIDRMARALKRGAGMSEDDEDRHAYENALAKLEAEASATP